MRKNIKKSVVVLLASLAMVPALTACENNDITTSKGNNNQSETKKTQVNNRKGENSEHNNSFTYYSMSSVLKVASLTNDKTFAGVSGIAVDPDTRAEYYFAIAGHRDRQTGIITITPRKTNKVIVAYHGNLDKLKTFNIHGD